MRKLKNIHEINLFVPAKAAFLLAHGHCRSPMLSHQLLVNSGNWEYIIYLLWHGHHWSHPGHCNIFLYQRCYKHQTHQNKLHMGEMHRATLSLNTFLYINHRMKWGYLKMPNTALHHLWCLLSGWFSISHLIFCCNLYRTPSTLFKKYCLKIPNNY